MIHYEGMTMSARTRRRALWLAAIGAAALAGLLVFLLVPNKKGGIATPTQTAPVQRVPRARQVPVTPERHAAIDPLFDHFVPLAMARRDPVAARAYVTPNLRSQATLADWRSGTIPVPPFEPKPPYNGWTTVLRVPEADGGRADAPAEAPAGPRHLVRGQPRARQGQVARGRDLRARHARRRRRAAEAGRGGDPAKPGGKVDNGLKGRLGFVWILVPLLLLSLIVIVPAAIFTRDWLADRRVMRRQGERTRKELPPLPRAPRD